jgi:hypothetical protein
MEKYQNLGEVCMMAHLKVHLKDDAREKRRVDGPVSV